MQEISYEIEVADLLALNVRVVRAMTLTRVVVLFLLLVAIGVDLNAAVHLPGNAGYKTLNFFYFLAYHLGILGLLALAFALLFPVTVWFIYRGPQPGVLGSHTVTLSPEALRERTDVTESQVSWQGVQRIDVTSKHIFIFLQPAAACVIPRRAFPSVADAEQFIATARAFWEATKKASA